MSVGVPPQRLVMSCSHCGKQRAALKRCSRCKQASYCGAACQNAAWKGHKKTCVTVEDVFAKVNAASVADEWREVLKWEGRMEEMLENQKTCDAGSDDVLDTFVEAHQSLWNSTGDIDHAISIVTLQERRVEVLGKMQRFRDQGEALCNIAGNLLLLDKCQEAEGYYLRARKLAEAHGFFSVESKSCLGLGNIAMEDGRAEEGLDLLRNAIAAAPLSEENDDGLELNALNYFTEALLSTHAIDEAEPQIARYREVAKAESDRDGRLCYFDLHSLYMSARLHEARGKPQEAAREMRALLDLMRENESRMQDLSTPCETILRDASVQLEILDPELGEEELITAVAVEKAKLVAWMAGSSEVQ